MVKFLRYFAMAAMGAIMGLSGHGLLSWQFWCMMVAMIVYGLAHNAESYKEAAGVFPWED